MRDFEHKKSPRNHYGARARCFGYPYRQVRKPNEKTEPFFSLVKCGWSPPPGLQIIALFAAHGCKQHNRAQIARHAHQNFTHRGEHLAAGLGRMIRPARVTAALCVCGAGLDA